MFLNREEFEMNNESACKNLLDSEKRSYVKCKTFNVYRHRFGLVIVDYLVIDIIYILYLGPHTIMLHELR